MKRAIVSAMMGIAAASVLLVAPVGASAEIVKTTMLDNPKCAGLCLRWWPKVTPPPKWLQDTRLSQTYNVAFLVPKDGRDDVFIYANAQPLKGQAVTVAGFMADDQATFERAHPGLRVRAGGDLITADGQVLRSRVFDPAPQDTNGIWETVAYGEEADGDGTSSSSWAPGPRRRARNSSRLFSRLWRVIANKRLIRVSFPSLQW